MTIKTLEQLVTICDKLEDSLGEAASSPEWTSLVALAMESLEFRLGIERLTAKYFHELAQKNPASFT